MRAALRAGKAQYPQIKVRGVVGRGPRKATVSWSIATRGATPIKPDPGLKGPPFPHEKPNEKPQLSFRSRINTPVRFGGSHFKSKLLLEIHPVSDRLLTKQQALDEAKVQLCPFHPTGGSP